MIKLIAFVACIYVGGGKWKKQAQLNLITKYQKDKTEKENESLLKRNRASFCLDFGLTDQETVN